MARKCQNTAAVVGGGVMKNGAGEQGVSGTATCKLSKASLKKIKSEPGLSFFCLLFCYNFLKFISISS